MFHLTSDPDKIMPLIHTCMRCGKQHGIRSALYCFHCSCILLFYEDRIRELAIFYKESESHYTERGYW